MLSKLPGNDLLKYHLHSKIHHRSSDLMVAQTGKISSSFSLSRDNGTGALHLPGSTEYRAQLEDRLILFNLIKSCATQKDLCRIRSIHSHLRSKVIANDVYVATALLSAYVKCGDFLNAREIFEQLHERNVVSWTALISGYVQHGLGILALECFRKMQEEGISPNVVTYVCILKACSSLGYLDMGKSIDSEVRMRGLLNENIMLGNALIDMYAKCGALEDAVGVFKEISMRDVISWNALLTGYVQHGLVDEALRCFRQMQDEGVLPDKVTYICVLKVCGARGLLDIAEDIHGQVEKQELFQKDTALGNTIVDVYAKCGALEKAKDAFEKLTTRNVVSWTALIMGYTQEGLGDEALQCFRQMQDEGVSPNIVTYVCILKACGIVGSLQFGEDIDIEVRTQGLLKEDIVLGNALVNMYVKCCALEKAREILEHLPTWDVVTWTALMFGYAQLGQATMFLDMFRKMREEGVVPDSIMFLVLLIGCSHAGLLEEGERFFNDMCFAYSLVPTVEHYACMIDLFGRSGYFDKANHLFENVSSPNRLPLFLAVLGVCHKWVNVKMGRWAFEQSIQLDDNCAATYVCMENIYAAAGMQTD